jgi:hypothetical protein
VFGFEAWPPTLKEGRGYLVSGESIPSKIISLHQGIQASSLSRLLKMDLIPLAFESLFLFMKYLNKSAKFVSE